ncbi:MAG: type II toxin-antitoxin system Phd/YefM family antitoxin [Geminicoccales bacterium]
MADIADDAELSVGVSAFKPKSLDLIERVASGKLRRVVLTKRGRPVAAVVPIDDAPQELWGALADLMEPVEGLDLTEPVGEAWAAENG